jgi:hypothetical protein
MPLRIAWLALVLVFPSFAFQEKLPRMEVDERFLRMLANVYPVPEYPAASVAAGHTGRVVVEVVVGPDGEGRARCAEQEPVCADRTAGREAEVIDPNAPRNTPRASPGADGGRSSDCAAGSRDPGGGS